MGTFPISAGTHIICDGKGWAKVDLRGGSSTTMIVICYMCGQDVVSGAHVDIEDSSGALRLLAATCRAENSAFAVKNFSSITSRAKHSILRLVSNSTSQIRRVGIWGLGKTNTTKFGDTDLSLLCSYQAENE